MHKFNKILSTGAGEEVDRHQVHPFTALNSLFFGLSLKKYPISLDLAHIFICKSTTLAYTRQVQALGCGPIMAHRQALPFL